MLLCRWREDEWKSAAERHGPLGWEMIALKRFEHSGSEELIL